MGLSARMSKLRYERSGAPIVFRFGNTTVSQPAKQCGAGLPATFYGLSRLPPRPAHESVRAFYIQKTGRTFTAQARLEILAAGTKLLVQAYSRGLHARQPQISF